LFICVRSVQGRIDGATKGALLVDIQSRQPTRVQAATNTLYALLRHTGHTPATGISLSAPSAPSASVSVPLSTPASLPRVPSVADDEEIPEEPEEADEADVVSTEVSPPAAPGSRPAIRVASVRPVLSPKSAARPQTAAPTQPSSKISEPAGVPLSTPAPAGLFGTATRVRVGAAPTTTLLRPASAAAAPTVTAVTAVTSAVATAAAPTLPRKTVVGPKIPSAATVRPNAPKALASAATAAANGAARQRVYDNLVDSVLSDPDLSVVCCVL
jgi:hypothetical protein